MQGRGNGGKGLGTGGTGRNKGTAASLGSYQTRLCTNSAGSASFNHAPLSATPCCGAIRGQFFNLVAASAYELPDCLLLLLVKTGRTRVMHRNGLGLDRCLYR